jgi:DNA-binding GntR family transcriptional regulator
MVIVGSGASGLEVELASRGETTYLALRRDILSCTLAPASSLTEQFLMERYKVGKSTCRLALARMVQEGFVRSVPRQGYVVTPITLRDVEELFELRLLLEPAAARLAVGKVNTDALAQIETAARSNKASRNSGNRISYFMDANREFHLAVAVAAGNSRLTRGISDVLDEMKRLVALGFVQQGASPEIAHDHDELIEALESGDGTRAERIATRHIKVFRDMTLDRVMKSIRLNSESLPLVAALQDIGPPGTAVKVAGGSGRARIEKD